MKPPFDLPAIQIRHPGKGACPELSAQDGRVLEERLLLGGEGVQPGRQDALDGFGQRRALIRSEATLLDQRDELLRVQGVPPRTLQQRRLRLGG